MPHLSNRWITLPFEECLDTRDIKFKKLKKKNIKPEGIYPVIDQGENFISGYIDNEADLFFGTLPVIIFGDHTRRIKFIDFQFAVGADGTKILHPFESLNPKFFYYYLRSLNIESQGYSRHYRFLKAIDVPVPSLNEQHRIVAKLEKLLTRVETCKERLEKIPALLKRFRQSVLAVACSGRLTADWREGNPEIEPVSAHLTRADQFRKANIAANQNAKSTNFRYKPAAQIDLENKTKGIDELFELPATWEWASLGQLTWHVVDGPHFSPKYVEKDEGLPFISGRNVFFHGIDFSDAKYVSREDHEVFSKRAKPLVGDVLLTKGGTTGIAAVVSQSEEFSIWVHVALLKLVPELVTPFYLRDVLSAPFVYAQSQAQTHGIGNQDLGLTRMVHMALPLPPLSEQQEIVRRVEALFKIADRIEERYKKAKSHIDRLSQSILTKAFRGELVLQDPNDEPVTVLIERIRALQSADVPMTKTGHTRATRRKT
ncbi:MAG: restriction endonuclease subunit S [Candidatus Omnitrophota bacterium]